MSTSIGIHNATSAHVERREYSGSHWLELEVKTADGERTTFTIFYDAERPLSITGDVAAPDNATVLLAARDGLVGKLSERQQ